MRVIWTRRARADLARIHDFNAEWSAAWAARVDARLMERTSALARIPLMGRRADDQGMRFLSVPDIQYVIAYAIAAGQVTILRLHSTRESREAE